ncbi:MAG: NAD-dependent epimerase/dehydratase family protein [Ilumatobacter sp.]|uniref:NAD-dependent epimerase/dehydratase family protein n=1 Tax=Ilumatobacter sp. TaxID=1967498 RepID=UPI0026150F94|nr:NAD-dependent epimerase/dehydratase family protein [Ilumatobacter sp.]MDJ0767312.1 NAD-dependent epimerase/dehydratase family protein [Ilumatobacter sp.]
MTRSLVTGGSGYFGSLLVRRLHADGHDVRVLDLVDASDRPGDVEFVAGDIRDPSVVAEAVADRDVVFHNVAQVPLARDERLLRSVNVDGTDVLLGAARSAAVSKVVHTSSSAVFGVPESNPVLPTTVPRPQEAYGHAKLAAEWVCLEAVARGLDVTIVRPRTVLGHGRLGIFGILFDWIADGADPVVLGDGRNRYQFVHAEDLADACVRASTSAGPDILNIGAPDVGTMFDAIDAVCRHAGTGATVRSLPARPAAAAMQLTARLGLTPFAPYHWLMYARSMWFDTTHAEERLGWTPRWTTPAMFAQSYDWFVEHRDAATPSHASRHRRTARQGALGALKRVSRFLPPARGQRHG